VERGTLVAKLPGCAELYTYDATPEGPARLMTLGVYGQVYCGDTLTLLEKDIWKVRRTDSSDPISMQMGLPPPNPPILPSKDNDQGKFQVYQREGDDIQVVVTRLPGSRRFKAAALHLPDQPQPALTNEGGHFEPYATDVGVRAFVSLIDGRERLVTCGYTGVKVLDVLTGDLVYDFRDDASTISCWTVLATPARVVIVIGTETSKGKAMDADTGEVLRSVDEDEAVRDLCVPGIIPCKRHRHSRSSTLTYKVSARASLVEM
jgi:hypothetical protein